MRYTNEEALEVILERGRELSGKKRQREVRLLGGAASLFALSLLLLIVFMENGTGAAPSKSVYGAFLLSPEAGGYVFTTVVAFVLGIAFVFFCRWIRDRHRKKHENEGEGS